MEKWHTSYKMGVHVAYTYNRKLYTGTITETGIHPDGRKPHIRHRPNWNDTVPTSTIGGLEAALVTTIISAYWKCYSNKSRWMYNIKRQAEKMLGKSLTGHFQFDWTK